MTEEEKKEVEIEAVENEVKEEEIPDEEKELKKKAALAGFIMSAIGFSLAFMWIAMTNLAGIVCGVAAIILGALAMKKAKVAAGIEDNPYKVFAKLAKIFGIISLILGIVAVVAVIVIWVLFFLIVGTIIVGWGITFLVELMIQLFAQAGWDSLSSIALLLVL